MEQKWSSIRSTNVLFISTCIFKAKQKIYLLLAVQIKDSIKKSSILFSGAVNVQGPLNETKISNHELPSDRGRFLPSQRCQNIDIHSIIKDTFFFQK